MPSEIWILGKDISIDSYPDGFFKDKITIGVNQAAITFKTTFAFSAYPVIIDEFLNCGIDISKIIGVKQTHPLPRKLPDGTPKPSEYSGLKLDKIYYNNGVRLQLSEINKEMEYLLNTRDKKFAYHNNGTAVQMVIYWCILHNYYPINLAGCNQSFQCSRKIPCGCPYNHQKFCVSKDIWEDSRNYTREMIRCLNLHGDYVRLYENYQDWLNKSSK